MKVLSSIGNKSDFLEQRHLHQFQQKVVLQKQHQHQHHEKRRYQHHHQSHKQEPNESLRTDLINFQAKNKSIKMSDDESNVNVRHWSSVLGLDMTMFELEEQLQNLVDNMDHKLYSLVVKTREEYKLKNKDKVTAKEIENLRNTATVNWNWIQKLSQLIQDHFTNAADYHLYCLKLLEYQTALPQIGVTERMRMVQDKYEGNYEEGNMIYKTTKDHLFRFLRWWQKVEDIIVESRKLKPLGLRTSGFDFKRPAKLMTNYNDNEYLYKGQDVYALKKQEPTKIKQQENNMANNEERHSFLQQQHQHQRIQKWEVETVDDVKINPLPSICIELSAPDITAIEQALLLRLDLMASWTSAVREIGSVLMNYIATILGYWSHIDISSCVKQKESKDDLYKSLDTMENLLIKYWNNSPQLLSLQTQVNVLKDELEIQDIDGTLRDETHIERNTMFIQISPQTLEEMKSYNSSDLSPSRSEIFVLQKRTINVLVNKYKDLHKYWDEYRRLIENSTELQLICDYNNKDESIVDNARTVPDELLSYLSSDDQMGWSRCLQLLKEKTYVFDKENNSDCHSKTSQGPLINVLPRDLKVISRQESENYKTGKQKSKLNVAVQAEKELKFFKNHEPKKKVDISQYFTNSLLPNISDSTSGVESSVRVKRHHSGLLGSTTTRSDVDTLPSPRSRHSTMPLSVSSLGDYLESPSSISGNDVTNEFHYDGLQYMPLRLNRMKSYTIQIMDSKKQNIPNYHDHKMKAETLPINASSFQVDNDVYPFQSKSMTLRGPQMEDSVKVNLLKECVQSCYLVVNMPRKDRILHVIDTKNGEKLTPQEALKNHIVQDEHFMEFLDTTTNTKHVFRSALSLGLVIMKPAADVNRNTFVSNFKKTSEDYYEKVVYKVDGIMDPNSRQWLSLCQAVKRNILSTQSGMLKVGSDQFEHIVSAISHCHLYAKRLYHCNIRSLPPEMTVELA